MNFNQLLQHLNINPNLPKTDIQQHFNRDNDGKLTEDAYKHCVAELTTGWDMWEQGDQSHLRDRAPNYLRSLLDALYDTPGYHEKINDEILPKLMHITWKFSHTVPYFWGTLYCPRFTDLSIEIKYDAFFKLCLQIPAVLNYEIFNLRTSRIRVIEHPHPMKDEYITVSLIRHLSRKSNKPESAYKVLKLFTSEAIFSATMDCIWKDSLDKNPVADILSFEHIFEVMDNLKKYEVKSQDEAYEVCGQVLKNMINYCQKQYPSTFDLEAIKIHVSTKNHSNGSQASIWQDRGGWGKLLTNMLKPPVSKSIYKLVIDLPAEPQHHLLNAMLAFSLRGEDFWRGSFGLIHEIAMHLYHVAGPHSKSKDIKKEVLEQMQTKFAAMDILLSNHSELRQELIFIETTTEPVVTFEAAKQELQQILNGLKQSDATNTDAKKTCLKASVNELSNKPASNATNLLPLFSSATASSSSNAAASFQTADMQQDNNSPANILNSP